MEWNRAKIWAGLGTIAGPVAGYWLVTAETSWVVGSRFVQVLAILGALLSIWCVAVLAIIGVALLAYTSRQIIRNRLVLPADI